LSTRTHADYLELYKRLSVLALIFGGAVAIWLITLGEWAGAVFLLVLGLLNVAVITLGPRLISRRNGRSQ
jgi:uncharacterized membrane protein